MIRLATRSKYRNVRTDGYASKKEADRAGELALMERNGDIRALEKQPRFVIEVNGRRVCSYVGDFRYYDVRKHEWVLEDVKSNATKTRLYELKKKLMAAVHNIQIREVL